MLRGTADPYLDLILKHDGKLLVQTQEIIDLLKQTSPLNALSFNLINRKQLLQESFRIKEVWESLL
jgi:hypothetical protein